MNNARETKSSRKFYISIIGLITGLLLFISSFSMLLNNTVFSSESYKTAFEKSRTYSLLAEMAETPAKDFTSKILGSSDAAALDIQTDDSVIGQQKMLMKSMVEDNVSDKMVRLNTDNLIDGLMEYFKGGTNSLPDLQLAGSAALNTVNLQVLIMYMGESRISDVLHLVSLSQYLLVHIPTFLLFLFPIIMAYMLKKSPAEIQHWLLSSAFFYSVLSLTACLLTRLLPAIFLKSIPAGIDFIPSSFLSELLGKPVFYFVNELSFYTFVSGMLFYVGINTALQINMRYADDRRTVNNPFIETVSKRKTILVLGVVLVSGMLFHNNLQSSILEFDKRDLGQTLAQLWENNPLYRVTDARNDLVYLLEVHMIDGNTEKPIANVGLHIEKSNSQDAVYRSHGILTDSNGTATFMLEKGSYTLMLDSYNLFAGFNDTQTHSYQFEMLTPGKSELRVLIGEKNTGLPYLADASLQFIP